MTTASEAPLTEEELKNLVAAQAERARSNEAEGYKPPWFHTTIDRLLATISHTRNAALEEAAREADAAYAKSGWHRYYRDAAVFIAKSIRALKETP